MGVACNKRTHGGLYTPCMNGLIEVMKIHTHDDRPILSSIPVFFDLRLFSEFETNRRRCETSIYIYIYMYIYVCVCVLRVSVCIHSYIG